MIRQGISDDGLNLARCKGFMIKISLVFEILDVDIKPDLKV